MGWIDTKYYRKHSNKDYSSSHVRNVRLLCSLTTLYRDLRQSHVMLSPHPCTQRVLEETLLQTQIFAQLKWSHELFIGVSTEHGINEARWVWINTTVEESRP